MKNVSEWWAGWEKAAQPVLLLGDGPTLTRLSDFDVTGFATVALTPRAASAPPVDVLCLLNETELKAEIGVRNATFLLMPLSLATQVADVSPFNEFTAAGRLITFELPSEGRGAPSQTAAGDILAVLASLGARTVRTLGVDFGFGPKPETVQANQSVARVVPKFDLYGPLTAEVPARVFIGTDPTQMLGAKIVEFSIRKHSTLTVQFNTMQNVRIPMPKDPKNQPRTHFSFNRFVIPQLAGYCGRALYMDADMQVFADFRELWEMPFGDATVLHAPSNLPDQPKQTSVMLLNCDRLRWDVEEIIRGMDEGKYDYKGLMTDMAIEPEANVQMRLPIVWNSLEEYAPDETRLLHYTHMDTQPWVSLRNPNGDLWIQAVRDAIAEGFITLAEVEEAVKEGFARPSLLWQLKTAPSYQGLAGTVGALLDVGYKPHRTLKKRLRAAGV